MTDILDRLEAETHRSGMWADTCLLLDEAAAELRNMTRERNELRAICDSYANENQHLSDRADTAEDQRDSFENMARRYSARVETVERDSKAVLAEYNAVCGKLSQQITRAETAERERDELRNLADRLKLEAQCHAGEARCANHTIAQIYQLCTGATGEPGNWNGAEPVRAVIAERDELRVKLATYERWTQTRFDQAQYMIATWLADCDEHLVPSITFGQSENLQNIITEALTAASAAGAAEERERCAKIAEAFPAKTHGNLATPPYAAAEQAAEEIAAAIRAEQAPP